MSRAISELLIVFSCKKRTMCPSCAGRRMANEAATLVDRVLPAVPVRQWVLSRPFELRTLAAFDAKVLTALSRIFAEAVGQWYRRRLEHTGTGRGATARPGAITFVQRFGSSLNLNVHFHTCFLDGTYERTPGGSLVFHSAPPPNRDDLDGVVRIVHQRTLRWLKRHRHLERPSLEERSHEASQLSPIEACAAIATHRGTTRCLAQDADSVPVGAEGVGSDADGPARDGGAVELDGFNIHASVRIAAEDDLGRERLMRYGARPPFSLDRFRRLPGGPIAYRIKKLGAGRAKHRLMTPLELLARLAAIVPPPRYPLVRYHGGARASFRMATRDRAASAPGFKRPPGTAAADAKRGAPTRPRCGDADSPRGGPSSDPDRRAVRLVESTNDSAELRKDDGAPGALALEARASRTGGIAGSGASADVANLAPNILGVRHWARVLGGLLYATSPRLRWPQLLQRTFDIERTAVDAAAVTGLVRITHPFHPQYGQEIELVVRRVQWGEDRVFYHSGEGPLSSLPTRWTSVVPEEPVVALTRGRTPFRLDDLIELTQLVSRLKP